jgi:hypothetical protein
MAGIDHRAERQNFRVVAVTDIDDARVIEAIEVAAEKRLNLVEAGYLATDTERPEPLPDLDLCGALHWEFLSEAGLPESGIGSQRTSTSGFPFRN